MSFEVVEKSPYDAEPIELFKFVGTINTYKLTTYSQEVTSGGDVYKPLAGLKRTVLKVGTQEDESANIDISMPFDHPLIAEYAYQTAPPTLEFELRRCHRSNPDDSILMWKGKVLSFSVEGRIAKMRVPSIFSFVLSGVTPAPRYQAPCNHILYDAHCQVDPASYQHVTTVTNIAGNSIQVASFPWSSGAASAGELRLPSKGESRLILGNVGTTIAISYPFASLEVGDSVTIFQGCDHSFDTCKAKFSNGVNFGGCPLVPGKNPFTSKP